MSEVALQAVVAQTASHSQYLHFWHEAPPTTVKFGISVTPQVW